jgi:carboxypeptidase Q
MKRIFSLCIMAAMLLGITFYIARADDYTPFVKAEAAADGTLPALTAIAGQGMMDSRAMDYLEQLSDDIGPRVTGSPNAARAIEWAQGTMRSIGLQKVHAEHWTLDHGWTRGYAHLAMLSPVHKKLMADAMGWVGSTPPGGVDADVVQVNLYQLDSEIQQNRSTWAGKVLLARPEGQAPKDRMSTFAKFGDFLKAAHAAGAVAVIGGQGGATSAGMNITHTGILGFDAFYDIPVVSMSAEDQALIERMLDLGRPVRLHVNVQNTLSGPVDSANAVGDIVGSEHPEQVIVIGGHLDSWDLATGSTDDGTGAVSALAAADAIIRSGERPRRTIRVVLFTGEEQGLLGSRAYVKQHEAEMSNHLAALILDSGQGPVESFSDGGHDDIAEPLRRFSHAIASFGSIGVNDRTSFGTDTGSFIIAGIPGIDMDQNSPEYRYTHHSGVDTFDKVSQQPLAGNATLMAMTAFWIASRPERLATQWPPEKTAKMLTDLHQDKMLKTFGMWPFGSTPGSGTEPK